jgi:hypothetical protein
MKFSTRGNARAFVLVKIRNKKEVSLYSTLLTHTNPGPDGITRMTIITCSNYKLEEPDRWGFNGLFTRPITVPFNFAILASDGRLV